MRKNGYVESYFVRIRPEERNGQMQIRADVKLKKWGALPAEGILEMPTSAERVLDDDRGAVLSSVGWPVARWEDVKKENRKYIRVRESVYNSLCKGSGSFDVKYSGGKRLCLYSVSRQGTKLDSGIFDGSGGECVCVCCVNRAAGRQGSGGGEYSTAGAEQTGQIRQAYGTESTRLSRVQFSWQLTTAREAEDSDYCRANKYRCVTAAWNLNRTARNLNIVSFSCARNLYIVLCLNVCRVVIISMRIYLGMYFPLDGVEEQCHV
jgi:hypothetical protein